MQTQTGKSARGAQHGGKWRLAATKQENQLPEPENRVVETQKIAGGCPSQNTRGMERRTQNSTKLFTKPVPTHVANEHCIEGFYASLIRPPFCKFSDTSWHPLVGMLVGAAPNFAWDDSYGLSDFFLAYLQIASKF